MDLDLVAGDKVAAGPLVDPKGVRVEVGDDEVDGNGDAFGEQDVGRKEVGADGDVRLEVLDSGDDPCVLDRQVEMIEALAGSDFPPLSSSRLSYQIKTTVCNLSPPHKSIAGLSFSIHYSPLSHNVHR